MAVCAGTEPRPINIMPIAKIMLRFITRTCPIADLIPFKTGCAQQIVGNLILGRLIVIIRRRQGSNSNLTSHFRVRCDGQRICRNMVNTQVDRRTYGNTPIVETLPRRTVNQIHAGTHAGSICRCDSRRHIGRGMRTIQCFQHAWHSRLHAERDAVESAVREFLHVIGVHRVRIRFGGDFRIVGNAPRVTHGIQHGDQIRGFQNRGSATAEKDGGRLRFVNAMRDLPIMDD